MTDGKKKDKPVDRRIKALEFSKADGENKDGPEDPRIKALEFFKDWSNYLLVTTVAALGWTATEVTFSPCGMKTVCVFCFAGSIMFGIFTLALIPVVTEQLPGTPRAQSLYEIPATFRVLWLWVEGRCTIKGVCFWQHLLFIVGIGVFAFYSQGKSQ